MGKRHRIERAENHRPRRDSEPGNLISSKACKESIQRSESIGQKQLMLAGADSVCRHLHVLCFMLYLGPFRKDYYNRKGNLALFSPLIMFCLW